jgi:hypothetical protein
MSLPSSRLLHVPPERLAGWLDGFAQRHGEPTVSLVDDTVHLHSPDQALASIPVHWATPTPVDDLVAGLVSDYLQHRRVGALIVRRRRHAVGIFDGADLISGRHHGHYVQGRTKAGGWSQQRYARRRAHQADRAYEAAIDDAVALLLPADGLCALAVGGDQAGITTVLADPKLASLRMLPRLKVPGIPDPNATVLAEFGRRYRLVTISVNEYA